MVVAVETWPMGDGMVLERRSQTATNPIPNILASTDPHCQEQLFATATWDAGSTYTSSVTGTHDSGVDEAGGTFDAMISESTTDSDLGVVLIPSAVQGAATPIRVRRFITAVDDNLPAVVAPAGGVGKSNYVASYSIRRT